MDVDQQNFSLSLFLRGDIQNFDSGLPSDQGVVDLSLHPAESRRIVYRENQVVHPASKVRAHDPLTRRRRKNDPDGVANAVFADARRYGTVLVEYRKGPAFAQEIRKHIFLK